jgi:hypothetical protein
MGRLSAGVKPPARAHSSSVRAACTPLMISMLRVGMLCCGYCRRCMQRRMCCIPQPALRRPVLPPCRRCRPSPSCTGQRMAARGRACKPAKQRQRQPCSTYLWRTSEGARTAIGPGSIIVLVAAWQCGHLVDSSIGIGVRRNSICPRLQSQTTRRGS